MPAYGHGNLLEAGFENGILYLHSGFSSTIQSTLPQADVSIQGQGIASTNMDLISMNAISGDRIYLHVGFTAVIQDSFLTGNIVKGDISWDGDNLLSVNYTTNKIFRHSGFSSTITDSMAGPATTVQTVSIDWTEAGNLFSGDSVANKYYKHSGFSTTIIDSFASAANTPVGCAWDGTDFYSSNYVSKKMYKHSGFTSTITDSFGSSGGTQQYGIAWDMGVPITYNASLSEAVGLGDANAADLFKGAPAFEAGMGDATVYEMTLRPSVLKILERVRRRLGNITTANGYFYTLANIKMGQLTPWMGYDLPACNFWSTGTVNEKNKYGTDDRTILLFVEIHALTRDEDFVTVAEKLACDGVTALNRDVQSPAVTDSASYDLKEFVKDLNFLGYDYEIGEGQEPFCGVILKFEVVFEADSFDMYNYERE